MRIGCCCWLVVMMVLDCIMCLLAGVQDFVSWCLVCSLCMQYFSAVIWQEFCYHFFSRIGEILLSTAVTQNTGLGRAVYVEDCSCPTGYTGLSCEVKPCPSFLRMGYTSCPTATVVIFGCLSFLCSQLWPLSNLLFKVNPFDGLLLRLVCPHHPSLCTLH